MLPCQNFYKHFLSAGDPFHFLLLCLLSLNFLSLYLNTVLYLYYFTLSTSEQKLLNKLQLKGLEDYKLATANASMNADLSMEERSLDFVHGMAALSVESGEAGPAKQQSTTTGDKIEKQTTANREV